MKKYKRWILVLTALTVFVVVQVESLKATSLIHAGKFSKLLNSTSTSTTISPTTNTSESEVSSADRMRALLDELPDDEEGVIDVNGTKITLTGIPQIDYVWDPNLPRELNGFNLSTYPFLDSMPADEDIGFDCEDKINGFYASIKFGCQLYHHCLYGVRSDFICANFTAFDQKTFICHFASEVDCKNSYKYWNRNDDLYKATTSAPTTPHIAPLFDRGFYNRTRSSFLNGGGSQSVDNNNNNPPLSSSSSNSQNGNANVDLNSSSGSQSAPNRNNNNNNNNNGNNDDGRPLRPLRRPPYRRRRPPPVDYYYYDDEYEDDRDFYDGRRRNRPRNRRPIYDDYDSRRPNDNRRPYYDDFDDYEYERRPLRNRNRSESKIGDERKRGNSDRRRPYDDDRRPLDDRRRNVERRPTVNDDDRRQSEERRFTDDRRAALDSVRRNPLADDKRIKVHQQPEIPERKHNIEEPISDEKLVKPVATNLFDRVRPAPKINRPVPLNEKNKFAYNKEQNQDETKEKDKASNDDAYEYEEDEVDSFALKSSTPKANVISTSTTKAFFQKLKVATSSPSTTAKTTTTTVSEIEYYDDEYYDTVTPTIKPIEISSIKPKDERASLFTSRTRNENNFPSSTTTSSTTTITTLASSPDSFRLNRYKNDNSRENIQQSNFDPLITPTKKPLTSPSITLNGNSNNNNSKKYANKQTVFEPVTQEIPRANPQPYFQNLYNNRHLEKQQQHDAAKEAVDEKEQKFTAVKIVKRPFLPSRGGNPYKARGLQPVGVLAEQQLQQQPKQPSEEPQYSSPGEEQHDNPDTHKITLEDLYNEEYDVDLNDALNPMLKPLTSSRGVSGYSFSSFANNNHPNDDKDSLKLQNQKILHKADHFASTSTVKTTSVSTTEQPEYYDDELEYTYSDDVEDAAAVAA